MTTSLDDYERLAIELARDAKRPAAINCESRRQPHENAKMPLFDTNLFTRRDA